MWWKPVLIFTSSQVPVWQFLGQRKVWNYIRKWIPLIWMWVNRTFAVLSFLKVNLGWLFITWVDRAFAILSFLKVNLGWRFINMIVDAIACFCVQLWSLYSVSGKFLHLPWMWFSLFFAVMYFVVVVVWVVVFVFCGWEVKWGVVLFCFVSSFHFSFLCDEIVTIPRRKAKWYCVCYVRCKCSDDGYQDLWLLLLLS